MFRERGTLKPNKLSKREKDGGRKVEKLVLTGKVAGEEEHHGEDDQERDVRLQDSCRRGIRGGEKMTTNYWREKLEMKGTKLKGARRVNEVLVEKKKTG